VKRRTLLQAIPAAAFLPESLWAAAQQENISSAPGSAAVYELRVYHAAPGKLADLLARFRDHTVKLFDRHGMKSVAYWTPVEEPEKSNTLFYILRHPSREAGNRQLEILSGRPGVEECQGQVRSERQTRGKS
jgi:hypothetical protein